MGGGPGKEVPSFYFFFFFSFFEVGLTYSVVLVSVVQKSDSVVYMYILRYTYIFFLRFFSIIGDYNILNTVPCATQ